MASLGWFGCLLVFCLFVLVFVFVCVASTAGQSSDETSESTNDSMSRGAKTATIVTMSAAIVKKKHLFFLIALGVVLCVWF